jgi:catechol 2,3-dioxygenase-like lactoylglutathione lyase family enzyme
MKMFNPTSAFSGFSVDNLGAAQDFYSKKLGLEVTDTGMGLHLHIPGNTAPVFVYPKGPAHQPATYTVLNFVVDDIDAALDELVLRGIAFEIYENADEKGIMRGLTNNMGPDIAWFKDPAGNIISILQEPK